MPSMFPTWHHPFPLDDYSSTNFLLLGMLLARLVGQFVCSGPTQNTLGHPSIDLITYYRWFVCPSKRIWTPHFLTPLCSARESPHVNVITNVHVEKKNIPLRTNYAHMQSKHGRSSQLCLCTLTQHWHWLKHWLQHWIRTPSVLRIMLEAG